LEDEAEVCQTCVGKRWVGFNVPVEDPRFGKVVPCPVCVEGTRANIDWFKIEGKNLRTETKQYRRAVRLARAMAQTPSGWLVIQGDVGTGKTTLARAILSHWRGKLTEPQTSEELLIEWRSHIKEEDFEDQFIRRCEATAAVLDDLGAERITDWTGPRLSTYLNWRWARRLPTVITTNCDEHMLAAHVDERVADRVFDRHSGLVRIVTLDVPSFRRGNHVD